MPFKIAFARGGSCMAVVGGLALLLGAGTANGASTTQVGSDSGLGYYVNGGEVECPAGTFARNGGTDVENVLTMRVATNAPIFPGGALLVQPDGPAPAPVGWTGFAWSLTDLVRLKVGAVCSADFALTSVVGSTTVAAQDFSSMTVYCPEGLVVVGGGIEVEDVLAMAVTESAPIFPGPTFPVNAPIGENPAPIGWIATAYNYNSGPRPAKVAVICADVVATAWVESAPIPAGSFGGANVQCPDGRETLGGGVTLQNVLTMTVTSSAPLFDDEDGSYLAQQPDGSAPAPVGWSGFARNDSDSSRFVKVAAICPEPGAVSSLVAVLLGLGLLAARQRR